MNRFALSRPASVRQAADAATTTVAAAMTAAPGATAQDVCVVKAGGIDLLDLLKEGLLAPAGVVDLHGVPGMATIERGSDGSLRIGALATLAQLAADETVRQQSAPLAQAAQAIGTPQIRHVATVGGNLLQRPRCWYFRCAEFRCLRKGGGHCFALSGENQYHAIFDNHPCAIVHPSSLATPLLALGAMVELGDAEGNSRRVLMEDFFVPVEKDLQSENDLGAREILTAVLVPPAGAARMAYRKQGERDSADWPLADVAVVLDLAQDGRCRSASVVLGAAAPTPHRARAAERALQGRRIDAAAARDAAHAALEGAAALSKNAYKLPLFEAVAQRAIAAAAGL